MINLLDIHVANLIAAGEVVDRPSSALKELAENAIDAGATIITIEIKNGGVQYMRVTDNGEGMSAEDLGRSILRHATSKIKSETDLSKIQTLGFRGEALAAISSVTDLKIFTKRRDSQTGWLLEAESGQNVSISEAGCPDGTTVITERMFAKIPARQKFLKRDATEGMYCKWIVEKIAVSNPHISFKFIQDGKQKIFTPGNGILKDAIYAVFGGEVADNLLRVGDVENFADDESPNVPTVSGYISRIEDGRKTRAEEHFFVNGRNVYSKTIMAALEEAYKSIADTKRFPFCVLNVKVDESRIDINVHPQKTEIRFSDEKTIFSAVYYAVKNALQNMQPIGDTMVSSVDTLPSLKTPIRENDNLENSENIAINIPPQPPRFERTNAPYTHSPQIDISADDFDDFDEPTATDLQKIPNIQNIFETNIGIGNTLVGDAPLSVPQLSIPIPQISTDTPMQIHTTEYKLIGEAFYGYIFLEKDDKIIVIDKHAAHERIIYDIILKRAAENKQNSQILLVPCEIHLNAQEAAGILNMEADLRKIGFEFEWHGDNISITEIPSELADADIEELIKELAYNGADGYDGAGDIHKIAGFAASKYAACRRAMKSGLRDTHEDIIWLADRVMKSDDVKYCPHGRPVIFEISKQEIDKRFGR